MWIVFLFFILIILIGFVNSTIEANLYKIELTDKKFNLKLVVSLKLFGIIRIVHADCNENMIKIFKKKITYKEIIVKAKEENIEIRKISVDFLKDIFKKLEVELKSMYFTLKIGLLDMALTNIVVIVLSSSFPLIFKSKINNKNSKYEIFPDYNNICVTFKGKIGISIKLLNLIKLYFKNIKPEITHNKTKNCDVKESC